MRVELLLGSEVGSECPNELSVFLKLKLILRAKSVLRNAEFEKRQ